MSNKLTVEELKAELDKQGIKYPDKAKKADLISLLPPVEKPQEVEPEVETPKEVLSFDIPGKINHEKFDKGGKAEATFEYLCKQPKKIAYIPLESGDIPGTTSAIKQFCYNRIQINIVKGVPVEMPEPLALYVEEIQAATRKAERPKTRDLNTGGTRDARLDLLSEAQKMGIL